MFSAAGNLKRFKACQLLHYKIFESYFPLRFLKCTYLSTERKCQTPST